MRMSLPALLVAVALAGACGPSAQWEVTATDALRVDVRTSPDPLVSGEPASFVLDVTNVGGERVVLRFDTTQRGDVRLSTPQGVEVHRWAERRVFSHDERRVAIPPGGRTTFRLDEPTLSLPPGPYELLARITATPKLPVSTTTISVDRPRVAGRAG